MPVRILPKQIFQCKFYMHIKLLCRLHTTFMMHYQYTIFYLFILFIRLVSAHNSVYARQNNLLAILYVHYTHLGLAHPMILYIIKMYQCITAQRHCTQLIYMQHSSTANIQAHRIWVPFKLYNI